MLRAVETTTRDGLPGDAGPDGFPTAGSADPERRIEDWVASYLEGDGPSPAAPGTRDWYEQLRTSAALWTPVRSDDPTRSNPIRSTTATEPGWARIRISRVRGITVVRPLDTSMVKEAVLREFADELGSLIDAGHHRLVLDFRGIERLSSQIVGVVAAAHRHCLESEDGQLKLCNLPGFLAQAFEITGVSRSISIVDDEKTAIEGPWPGAGRPRLPVAILEALAGRVAVTDGEGLDSPGPKPPCGAEPVLRLVVDVGPARGRSVEVRGPRFVIGRDPGCDLRSRSPSVSRFHAAFHVRPTGVFLRDLGSTNGTHLNDGPLIDGEVRLVDGDRIAIGPLRFVVVLGPGSMAIPPEENQVAAWLAGKEEVEYDPAEEGDSTALGSEPTIDLGSLLGAHPADDPRLLKAELLEGVLVVTPLVPDLLDEPTVSAFRAELHALFDEGRSSRVVVNLVRVSNLSGRAIGVLVAENLRIGRAGGALRLCQVQVPVRSALDVIRLPLLIGVFPTLDEAVLTTWE